MNCKYHKESEAKFICDKCKQAICEECAVDVNGSKVCGSCIQKSLFHDRRQYHGEGFLEKFMFFCFAMVPGAAQMYMNLFKRGFQLMFGFIASIVLFSYINTEGIIPLITIPMWFFSFFDSYAIRRKIRDGEIVEDNLIFDYGIIIKNKGMVGVAMLVLGALGTINAFEYSPLQYMLGGHIYSSIKRSVISVALIIAGIYVLLKSRNSERKMKTESIESTGR